MYPDEFKLLTGSLLALKKCSSVHITTSQVAKICNLYVTIITYKLIISKYSLILFYFDLNFIQKAKNQELMELHDHKARQLAWRGYGKHLGSTFRKIFHESM